MKCVKINQDIVKKIIIFIFIIYAIIKKKQEKHSIRGLKTSNDILKI